MPSEVSERPKLKLLPRFKPLENLETNYRKKLGDIGNVKNVNELHENLNPLKSGLDIAERGSQPVEREVECPKLNLKPWSQPLEHSDSSLERERNTFGGTRPRELERGINVITISNLDMNHSSNRVNSAKNEALADHSVLTARNSQRAENVVIEKRNWRDYEREHHRMDHDVQRGNCRNEN